MIKFDLVFSSDKAYDLECAFKEQGYPVAYVYRRDDRNYVELIGIESTDDDIDDEANWIAKDMSRRYQFEVTLDEIWEGM